MLLFCKTSWKIFPWLGISKSYSAGFDGRLWNFGAPCLNQFSIYPCVKFWGFTFSTYDIVYFNAGEEDDSEDGKWAHGSRVEGKIVQDQLFMWIVDACLALYADVIFRLYYVIHFYNLGDYVIVILPSPLHWGPDFVFLRVGLNIGGLQCLWRFFRPYIGKLTILLELKLHVLWKLLP